VSNRHLGKKARRVNPFAPRLADLLATVPGLVPDPLPPFGFVDDTDWTEKVGPLGPMLNNQIGCCTISAVGHIIQVLSSISRPTPVVMSDGEVLSGYSAVSGYQPGNPASDTGAVMMDVLERWMTIGFMAGGELHKIDGFVTLDPMNPTELKFAIQRFGAIYCGLELPISAQQQSTLFTVVDPALTGVAAPGSWGGHCVPGGQFNPNQIGIITWGARCGMDWQFLQAYMSECYAVFDRQDEMLDGFNRDGFSIAQLVNDLARLRAGIAVG
jgi:hypothetical protein